MGFLKLVTNTAIWKCNGGAEHEVEPTYEGKSFKGAMFSLVYSSKVGIGLVAPESLRLCSLLSTTREILRPLGRISGFARELGRYASLVVPRIPLRDLHPPSSW